MPNLRFHHRHKNLFLYYGRHKHTDLSGRLINEEEESSSPFIIYCGPNLRSTDDERCLEEERLSRRVFLCAGGSLFFAVDISFSSLSDKPFLLYIVLYLNGLSVEKEMEASCEEAINKEIISDGFLWMTF